jgi:hypothetical protein
MLHEDASIVVHNYARSFCVVIRPIRRDELAPFAAFSAEAERDTALATSLNNWLSGDQTLRDWLFVAAEDGVFVGRVAITTDRGLPHPLYVHCCDSPWGPEAVALPDKLFRRSLALSGADHVPEIAYYLATPSERVPDPDALTAALYRFGFALTLEGVRVEWTPASALPTPSPHLTFHTLAAVGEDAFSVAMARVWARTLDSHTPTALCGDRRACRSARAFPRRPTLLEALGAVLAAVDPC